MRSPWPATGSPPAGDHQDTPDTTEAVTARLAAGSGRPAPPPRGPGPPWHHRGAGPTRTSGQPCPARRRNKGTRWRRHGRRSGLRPRVPPRGTPSRDARRRRRWLPSGARPSFFTMGPAHKRGTAASCPPERLRASPVSRGPHRLHGLSPVGRGGLPGAPRARGTAARRAGAPWRSTSRRAGRRPYRARRASSLARARGP